MVSDAEARAFDVLLVRETSRFARNWRQAGGYEDRLHDAGVVIAYIYEGRLSTDRAGQLQLVVNHAINEEQREKLADNVQRGYRVKRFEAGKFSGTPPIGYVMEYEDVTVDGAKGYERQETGRLLPDTRPRPRWHHRADKRAHGEPAEVVRGDWEPALARAAVAPDPERPGAELQRLSRGPCEGRLPVPPHRGVRPL